MGLGVLSTKTDKTAYQHLLEFVDTYPGTQKAQPVELNVGGDPVAGLHKELVTDHVLITGDAAGMVNPLDGGGIISGMTGGRIAGEIRKSHFRRDYSQRTSKNTETLPEKIGFIQVSQNQKYLLSLSDENELHSRYLP